MRKFILFVITGLIFLLHVSVSTFGRGEGIISSQKAIINKSKASQFSYPLRDISVDLIDIVDRKELHSQNGFGYYQPCFLPDGRLSILAPNKIEAGEMTTSVEWHEQTVRYCRWYISKEKDGLWAEKIFDPQSSQISMGARRCSIVVYSKDGNTIISVKNIRNRSEIWLSRGDIKPKKVYETSSTISSVDVSDNGEKLLFCTEPKESKQNTQCWIMKSDGKDIRCLTPEDENAWSPIFIRGQNHRIIYLRFSGIWETDATGKKHKQLKTDLGAYLIACSPDGMHLALACELKKEGKEEGIYLSDTNFRSIKKISSESRVLNLSFSPDGSLLAFHRESSPFSPSYVNSVIIYKLGIKDK